MQERRNDMHQKLPFFWLKEVFFLNKEKPQKTNIAALGAVNSQFMLHGEY